MSKNIKKINQTIATFMLVSCALSGSSLAKINEDLLINKAESTIPAVKIANNMPTMGSVNPTPMLLYGVPNDIPTVTPVVPPALLYGVPNDIPTVTPIVTPMAVYAPPNDPGPVMPAYAVPFAPPNDPGPVMPAYAVPVNPASAVSASAETINQQINSASSKNAEVNIGIPTTTGQKNKDKDARVPVNYVAPVIIPRYYIMDQK